MSEPIPIDDLPGPTDLRWDDQAQELQFSQLEQVRSLAERWRGGLAGMTALVTTILAVAGPAAGKSINSEAKPIVGLLALFALLSLSLGTWLVMGASFGVPTQDQIWGTGERLRA